MNKLSKRILLVTATGTVLIALLFVALDIYVGSRRVRTRLESTLSKEFGAPVKVGGLHYSLWSGLRASGLTVAVTGTDGSAQSTLVVPEASAHVAICALFSHCVVVKRLVIAEPTLVLGQNRDGSWNLPLGKREAMAGSLPQKSPQTGKRSSTECRIRDVRMKNATLRFVDREGVTLGLLEGVNVKCPHGVLGDFEGSFSIGRATFHDGVSLDGVSSPFSVSGGFLSFPQLDARLAGGSVRGSGKVALTSGHPPFTLDLLFDGVDINQLLTALGEEHVGQRTEGTVNGCIDLYGSLGKKKSLAGTGQVRVRGGRMEQIPLLQLIGKVLSISELTNLELQQAQLDLRAAEGKLHVDSLVLESPNLSIAATGTSSFDGKLDLAARLFINPKIGRQLPNSVESNFQPVPGSDRRVLGFRVTGTLARPETDLMRVLVGQKYESQMMDLWRTLTGKQKKKPGDKKKPEPEVSPTQDSDMAPDSAPPSQPVGTPAS